MQRAPGHSRRESAKCVPAGLTPGRAQGFTLVELLVTVAVLAIILALAMPSFTAIVNSNRLAAGANEMVASIQLARMESIRRNLRVAVCESSNGTTCTGGDLWAQWITVADANRDGTFSNADEVLRVSTPKGVQVRGSDDISGNSNRIEFRADGLARDDDDALLDAEVGVCIATTQPVENQRLVGIGSGSRISTAPDNAGGSCAAP
jgi:type IV fimbrial biogenesis protein FimT